MIPWRQVTHTSRAAAGITRCSDTSVDAGSSTSRALAHNSQVATEHIPKLDELLSPAYADGASTQTPQIIKSNYV